MNAAGASYAELSAENRKLKQDKNGPDFSKDTSNAKFDSRSTEEKCGKKDMRKITKVDNLEFRTCSRPRYWRLSTIYHDNKNNVINTTNKPQQEQTRQGTTRTARTTRPARTNTATTT